MSFKLDRNRQFVCVCYPSAMKLQNDFGPSAVGKEGTVSALVYELHQRGLQA